MEIIIIAIIFFAIKNSVKKGASQNKNKQPYNQRPPQPYQQPVQARPQRVAQTRMQQSGAVAKPMPAKPIQSEKDSVDRSTIDYLHQKAMEDQREHTKEKMEERKRLSEKYGGRAVAMRYLPGDRIPHGMRVVNCSYCNAENLVETIRTDRACYFCRTKL